MAGAAAQARSARSQLPELTVDRTIAASRAAHFLKRSPTMPTFHIELFEGRSLEQKRQFVEAITKATCESLGVEPNSVDIILTDVKRENWATGGRLWSDSGK
ncbi:4-oxalocrotonate tautomerase [Paraburkholderia phenoliruptrix]|uniref:4-oxalocrotonate tautomerase n=2 Tax=Paraburkholderia phenoliruptrix TaxID=252970 RepID=A0ABV3WGF1_9BURK|nr:4-oxalocrotonate tautomerase [Paraburkholderia phenoliruptrix]